MFFDRLARRHRLFHRHSKRFGLQIGRQVRIVSVIVAGFSVRGQVEDLFNRLVEFGRVGDHGFIGLLIKQIPRRQQILSVGCNLLEQFFQVLGRFGHILALHVDGFEHGRHQSGFARLDLDLVLFQFILGVFQFFFMLADIFFDRLGKVLQILSRGQGFVFEVLYFDLHRP